MKHLRLFFYVLTIVLIFSACGDDDDVAPTEKTVINVNANTGNNTNAIVKTACKNLEFPHLKESGNNVVIVHIVPTYGINYCVEWDIDKKSQRWSCYQMHNGNNVSNTIRYRSDTNQYPNDPFIDPQYHFTVDPYWNSGYDHGHICPSADRLCSYDANYQTFFLTNMQPQVNTFNAGIWEHMESQLRNWNNKNFRDTLYVVKGGTIDSEDNLGAPNSRGQEMKYIGSGADRIPVPKYFYMAILCKTSKNSSNIVNGYKALAFWAEHKSNYSTELNKYVINIDELERKTGIDFFCNLPDDIETLVESTPVETIVSEWF